MVIWRIKSSKNIHTSSLTSFIFCLEVGKDGKYINIKLPDDILKHFEKQYGIGNDDHISNILGKLLTASLYGTVYKI